MRVGLQVEMVRAVDTSVASGTVGRVVALEPPSGRARVAWETGVESLLPGARDEVIVRGPKAATKRDSRRAKRLPRR